MLPFAIVGQICAWFSESKSGSSKSTFFFCLVCGMSHSHWVGEGRSTRLVRMCGTGGFKKPSLNSCWHQQGRHNSSKKQNILQGLSQSFLVHICVCMCVCVCTPVRVGGSMKWNTWVDFLQNSTQVQPQQTNKGKGLFILLVVYYWTSTDQVKNNFLGGGGGGGGCGKERGEKGK